MTDPTPRTPTGEAVRLDVPSGSSDPRMLWGSDVAAQMLRRFGIRYVSLNPGASFRGLHDSLVNHLGNRDPAMLLCLHEEHAVAIAHGYAKVTGEPMAVVLHSNVGLMHGLMGVFNAWCDRVPMLILGATGPVDAAARRPWIDWLHTARDQGALLRSYVKWDDQPASVPAMVESLCRANLLTRASPQAPVYVCLDAGLQEASIGNAVGELPDVSRFAPPDPPRPSAAALRRAVELLSAAERPLILAGRGRRDGGAWRNRVALAERLGARVLSDLKAGAAFPTDHPLHAAPPFNFLSEAAREAMRSSDLLLALDWVDLAGTLRQAFGQDGPPVPVVAASPDHHLHNGWSMDHQGLPPLDVALGCDPDAAVADLLAALPSRELRPLPPTAEPAAADGPRGMLRAVADALRAAVPDPDRISLVAVGRGWPMEAWPLRDPLAYLGKDGGGGVGSGLGISIGAALALQDRGRLAVAVLGDGDVSMGLNALWTAAHYRVPLLVIVANNRSYLNDELHQEAVARERGRDPANRWVGQQMRDPDLDFVKLAEGQGVRGIGPVARAEDVPDAIASALATVADGLPCLVDVHTPPGQERSMNEAMQQRAAKG